jgi:hypothetical protein
MAIPKEYLDMSSDFGFSAIDDETIVAPTTPAAPAISHTDITDPIVERIRTLEINVGEALSILERIENASTPLDTEEYKALLEKDIQAKLKTVEGLILPLLVNLMKHPEKDTIKWPNRGPIIEGQINKILAITRS